MPVRRKETRQKPDADQQAGSPDECRRVIWLQVEKQGSNGTAGKESRGDPKKYTGQNHPGRLLSHHGDHVAAVGTECDADNFVPTLRHGYAITP
jgi:hypothetical protein